MTKNIFLFVFGLIILAVHVNGVYGFDYVVYDPETQEGDCNAYDYPDAAYPGKWETYTNPNFNVPFRRFSDLSSDAPDASSISCHYTTFSVGNSDDSMVLFVSDNPSTSGGGWLLYDASDGQLIKGLTLAEERPANPSAWPRWDDEDPHLLYFQEGPFFKKIDVMTEQITLIHDFTDGPPGTWTGAEEITLNDKGDGSWDRRWWGFNLKLQAGADQNKNVDWLVYYDLENDNITGVLNVADFYQSQYGISGNNHIRLSTASASGNYIIVSFAAAYVDAIFDKNYNYLRSLFPSQLNHMAWGYDTEGYEVLIRQYSDDYWAGRLATGETYQLVDPKTTSCNVPSGYFAPPNQMGYHMSTIYDVPGWVFITHYGDYVNDAPTHMLSNEVFAIQIKPQGLVWRVGYLFGDAINYNNQNRGSLSQDGKYIYFDTNWKGQYNPEMFRAELPDNWWNEILDADIIYECNDSLDNDGDGYIDLADVGCASLTDVDETDCGDDVCEGSEDCSDCPEDCLDTGEQCCNGIAYDPTSQVCCSGAVYTGICCDDSDCTLPETCNVNHVCSEPEQTPGICNGLKLLMHFDEDILTTLDDSGNGNHGTVNGATFISSGKFSGAFEFDGLNDYIQISDSDSLDGYDTMSFGFWIKINEISEGYFLLSKYIANNGYRSYSIRTDTSPTPDISFVVSSDGINYEPQKATTDLTTDGWYNVVVVFDAGAFDVYVDGAPVSDNGDFATETSIHNGFSDLFIGTNYGASGFFNGTIDEVAIWDRALSFQEISGLYDNAGPISCQTTSSCTSGADKDDNGEVSMDEVVAFIGDWKTGSITIAQILEAIGEWKSGC